MSVEQERDFITGEEFTREWRRLMQSRAQRSDPAYEALIRRVAARDEHLYERYATPYLRTHAGQWIAVAADGRVVIRERSADALRDAEREFGPANFAFRRLADFPGHDFSR
jgi:hypothetical protein